MPLYFGYDTDEFDRQTSKIPFGVYKADNNEEVRKQIFADVGHDFFTAIPSTETEIRGMIRAYRMQARLLEEMLERGLQL